MELLRVLETWPAVFTLKALLSLQGLLRAAGESADRLAAHHDASGPPKSLAIFF
jgi:hypothetical protein